MSYFCSQKESPGRGWGLVSAEGTIDGPWAWGCCFYLPQGPFATFKMQYDRTCEWTGLKFSNDGKLILISTNGSFIRLIDAFKGVVMHTFGVSWQPLSLAVSILDLCGLRTVLAGWWRPSVMLDSLTEAGIWHFFLRMFLLDSQAFTSHPVTQVWCFDIKWFLTINIFLPPWTTGLG